MSAGRGLLAPLLLQDFQVTRLEGNDLRAREAALGVRVSAVRGRPIPGAGWRANLGELEELLQRRLYLPDLSGADRSGKPLGIGQRGPVAHAAQCGQRRRPVVLT